MLELPSDLIRPTNERVLAYLRDRSADDEIASTLLASVKPLGDARTFCPDAASYRYVLVSTAGIVFGFAVGQDTIAFRLDARMRDRALATGGRPWPESGEEWVAVVYRRSDDDWPSADVTFWARKAYVYARQLTS
jgi:hypothetical protein